MIRPCLLQHFLECSAERLPEKKAIQSKGDAISYTELCAKSKSLGVALQKLSTARGERVGIFLDKSIEQVVALLGVLYADKIFVLMNSTLHPKQVSHILNDCEITTVITDRALRTRVVDQAIEGTAVRHVVCEEDFSSYLDRYSDCEPECRAITDDISNIIYTSGSTGLPKGIVITHRNLIDGAKIVSEYLKIRESDKLLGLLPFSFDYGLNQLTSTLYNGSTIYLYKYALPNDFLKIIDAEKITGLAAIPPIWASAFNPRFCDSFKNYNFESLRYITNSGGRLAVPIVQQIRKAFPKTNLYLMYGLTEAFRSTYLDPKEVDVRPDSIGKAIPNVEIEVVNDRGERCGADEPGELIHRGACIARGYWKNPKKTHEVYRPNPLLPKGTEFLETVVYSGDIVKKDGEGFLYFIGRKDHQIKTAGYRVSPTEVEQTIMRCEGVSEVVVFGLKDDQLGEKIRAVVTLTKEIAASDVIAHCHKEAPAYMSPREVFVINAFPKTATGKLDRPKIIDESMAQHGL